GGTGKDAEATGAILGLGDGMGVYVAAGNISDVRVDDASQHLKVGDAIGAKYLGQDRKSRTLQLAIRAKDEAEAAETLAEYNKAAAEASSGTTKLGALLREQLENKSE